MYKFLASNMQEEPSQHNSKKMEVHKTLPEVGANDNNGEIFTLKTRFELPRKELIDFQAKFTLEHYNLFAISLKGTGDLILLSDGRHTSSFKNLLPILENRIVGNCGGASWALKHIPWFDDLSKKITALSFDEDGTLYIGLLNGTIYELNAMTIASSTENTDVDLHNIFQLDDLQILDILIWFKGNSKVILCNGGNGKFLLLPTNSLPTLVTFNSPIRSIELYIGGTNLACALICLENGQNVTTVLDDLDLPAPGENLVKKSIFRRAKDNIISRFGDSEKGNFFGRKNSSGSTTTAVTNTESIAQPQENSSNVVLATKVAPTSNIKMNNLEDMLCRGDLRKIIGNNQFFRHKENKLDIFDNDFRQTSSVYIPSYINKLYIIHKIFFGVDDENRCLRISLVHNAMLKEFAIVQIPSRVLFIEPIGESDATPYSVFITTQNEVYQMCLTKSPIEICVELLMKETVSALLDVVCIALNVSKLDAFVKAGDKCSQEGKYAKTIIYYKLAGMNHPKIIAKFGSRGLIPAMIYFSELVEEERHKFLGSLKDKCFMANIVVLGKIEQFVRHGQRNNLSTDPRLLLGKYLKNNLYYTSKLVAISLCYPELLWALEIVGITRLCYQDILLGLYRNREKFDDSPRRQRYWKLLSSDWMTLYSVSSDIFMWFRSMVLKNLSLFEDDTLHNLIVKLIPWRGELQQKLFNESPDLTEIIDFTVTRDAAQIVINDYIEIFITLLLEAIRRHKLNASLQMKLPVLVHSTNALKTKTDFNKDASNNIAQVLMHLSFNTTFSASLHECACIRNEKVYTWGESRFGRLGIKDELDKPRTNIDTPTQVQLLAQLRISIVSISCGQCHNMALTKLGRIFIWGSNGLGQLGLGSKVTFTNRPVALEKPNVPFCCISAGGYHSVAVDHENNVWTWGWGIYGQLGYGGIEKRFRPEKINIPQQYGSVIQASAGHSHTALLTNTGKVLVFGCSHFGQLGLGLPNVKVKTPTVMGGLPSGAVVKFINSGVSGTALVTMRNRLFYCGLNPSSLKSLLSSSRRNGKPTEVNEEKDFTSPTLIGSLHLMGAIVKVSVATTHLGVLTSQGYVYTYGLGKSGQLVRPDDENKTLELIDCDDRMIICSDVVCAGDCTFLLEKDTGKLFGCGFNSSGQLGKMECDDETSIMTIRTKKRIVKVRQPANIYFRPREVTGLPRPYLEEDQTYIPEILPPTDIIDQELLEWSLRFLLEKYSQKQIKNMCVKLGNYKAAALIDKLHDQFEAALKHDLADADDAKQSGKVISNYVDDVENRKKSCLPQICAFLTIVVNHWRKKNLPGDLLEGLLDVFRQLPDWKIGLSYAVKETMTLNDNTGNESAEWMAAHFTPAFILSCFKFGENVPSDSLSGSVNFLETDSGSEDELEEIDLIDT